MKSIKDNKGITNMTLITIVLVIIILMLLVAVIYLLKNPNTTYITQNLPTEQSKLSSTVTENKTEIINKNVQTSNINNNAAQVKNQYGEIKGVYYGINDVYYDSAEAEIPCEYKLYLNNETIMDSNKYYEEFLLKDIILTKKSTELTKSLKLHIDNAIRNNAISKGN